MAELSFLCNSMSDIEITSAKKRKCSSAKYDPATSPDAVEPTLTHSEEHILRKFGLYELLNENSTQIKWIGHEFNCAIRLEKSHDTTHDSSTKTIYSFSRADIEVTVEEGDITDMEVDLIVNTVGINFSFTGELAKAILAKGGEELRTECNRLPSSFDNIKITSGGKLPCKKVMHVHVPSTKTKMDSLITDILLRAEGDKALDLALPAIGTGGGGWRSRDVATGMYKGITRFLALPSVIKHLRNIRIVLLPTTPSIDKMEFHAAFGNFIVLPDQVDTRAGAITALVGTGRRRLKARRRIKAREESTKHLDKHVEANPTISSAQNSESSKRIADCSSKLIFASTNSDNILKARKEVEKFIDLQLKNFTLIDDVIPMLSLEQTSKLKRVGFEKKVGVEIYESTKEVVVQGKVRPAFDAIDEIRRLLHSIPKAFLGLPSEWKEMNSDEVMSKVPLELGTTEYVQVETYFNDTNTLKIKFNIVRVERIQNPELYGQYAQNKSFLCGKVKCKIPERRLFHGTTSDVIDNICRDGFNRSYAGKNATKLGKGVYFSNSSSVSHCYGKKYIFLAGVLTGDFCSGHGTMVEPPMNPTTRRRYDSVVDDTTHPTIFVIFKDAHAYPAYLITYEKG